MFDRRVRAFRLHFFYYIFDAENGDISYVKMTVIISGHISFMKYVSSAVTCDAVTVGALLHCVISD